MRLAFPISQTTLVRSACIAAVALGMAACDSSTSPNYSNQINIVGGDAQTVAANSPAPLPLTVVVTDLFGNPVANAVVNWSIESGTGSVTASATKTGLDGRESAIFTGGTAGDATVRADVAGIYITHFTEHVQ